MIKPVTLLLTSLCTISLLAQTRNTINIPDVLGYRTLKADLHIHTVFSDGRVWPDIRVEEAWRDGLDVIAITDHINYKSPIIKKYLNTKDKNAHYNEAIDIANSMGISLIKAIEYNAPGKKGHYNFFFLEDINEIEVDKENYLKAFQTAKEQGAFIQWNHPPYKQEKKDHWEDTQETLLKQGLLDGIEIVGHTNHFNKAMQWAEEFNLSITSSSDIHYLIDTRHEVYHRPITLIFAKQNSIESIKEALFQKRTLAYYQNRLIGDSLFTKAIFDASINVKYFNYFKDKNYRNIAITNNSDIPYTLTLIKSTKGYKFPKTLYIPANKTILDRVTGPKATNTSKQEAKATYRVENISDLQNQNLEITI
ncbi:Sb-PDE family phosphodiesterase [Myroides odoratimimus]|uniref:Sb-PDE family phosphodiesterase n=1 Tax=Myroides odoratimimus TaxID=76832 RepID=UPI001CE0F51A|nr:Sb-PDE family phosphodiesterase [Myroides odoratimimus]MCA4806964.1 PHP domain-containing protein [Myroides odoratimimus]